MEQTVFALSRTLFLPKGSPPILNIENLKIDVRKKDISEDNGYIFCAGDIDILIDYMSQDEQHINQGHPWQVFISLPFEMKEKGHSKCPPLCELGIDDLQWFVVAPRALELSLSIILQQPESYEPCPGEREWAGRLQSAEYQREELIEKVTEDLTPREEEVAKMASYEQEIDMQSQECTVESRENTEDMGYIQDMNVVVDIDLPVVKENEGNENISLAEAVLAKNQMADAAETQVVAKAESNISLSTIQQQDDKDISPVSAQPLSQIDSTGHCKRFCLRFYRVQPGEEALSVALRFGVSMDELAAKNKIQPQDIHSGMMLAIPC